MGGGVKTGVDLVVDALQLSNPLQAQAIACFTLCVEDEWKLAHWKRILAGIAQVQQSFLLTPDDVHQRVNLLLQQRGAYHAIELETVQIAFRALVNQKHCVMLRDVLASYDGLFTRKAIVPGSAASGQSRLLLHRLSSQDSFSKSGGVARLGIRTLSSQTATTAPSPGILSRIGKFFSGGGGSPEFGSSKSKSSFPPGMSRPSNAPLGPEEQVVLVQMALEVVEEFATKVFDSFLEEKGTVSAVVPDGVIVEALALRQFLTAALPRSKTLQHTQVAIWTLAYLGSRPCTVFRVKSEGSADPLSNTAIKFAINSNLSSLTATAVDEAALAEAKAMAAISERVEFFERRAAEAETQCKSHLKAGQRAAALTCLKKKKLLEHQLVRLQEQLLRLEETRCIREGGQSISLVANALQASVHSAKSVVDDDKVHLLVSQAQEAASDLEVMRDALSRLTLAGGVSADQEEDADLAAEYEKLMSAITADAVAAEVLAKNNVLAGKTAEPATVARSEAEKCSELSASGEVLV